MFKRGRKTPREKGLPNKYPPIRETKAWKTLREAKWREAAGICAHCQTITLPKHPYLNFHLDHIKPVDYGKDPPEKILDPNNTQILCANCHLHKTIEDTRSKHDQTYFIDPITGDIATSPFTSHQEQARRRKQQYVAKHIKRGNIKIRKG